MTRAGSDHGVATDGSNSQLVKRLRALQADAPTNPVDEVAGLVHSLEVHQVELEMQNQALRESQCQLEGARALYSDLYDFAPIGYCTLDGSGRIWQANLTLATMLGIERKSLMGRGIASVVVFSEIEAFRDHLRRCINQRESVTDDLKVMLKSGRTIIARWVSVPTKEGDQVLGCRTAITDVTVLKQSQLQLQFLAQASLTLASSFDYETNLARVAQAMVPLVADVCLIDYLDPTPESPARVRRLEAVFADPKVRSLSEYIKRRLHAPYEDAPQLQVLQSGTGLFLPAAPLKTATAAVGAHPYYAQLADKTLVSSIIVLPINVRQTVWGTLTLIMLESRRSFSETDRILGEDVAARMGLAIDNAQLFLEAQQAVKTREEILGMVSHDLRNPLSALMLNSDVLLSTPPQQDRRKCRKQLESNTRAAHQMNRMIADLLDFSRIDSGHLSVDKRDVGVDLLLNESCEFFTPLAKKKNIQLKVDSSSTAMLVSCDRDRVLQVFSNLIANAIKFTPENGQILLTAKRQDGKMCFSVSDTGPGIPIDSQTQLFQCYWQAKETASKGTGLGLYIAKGIVRAHGGDIGVRSAPGQGATFFFTLDCAEGSAIVSVPLHPARRASVQRIDRVLVVDDNEEICRAVASVLEMHGYEVTQARDGSEALENLRATDSLPSLMLLDLHMPKVDGWQVMAAVRADSRLAALRVLIMSSHEEVGREAKLIGAQGYIEKPVRIDSLLRSIRAGRQEKEAIDARSPASS